MTTSHAEDPGGNTIVSTDGFFVLENPFSRCTGHCGVYVFAGKFLDTNMSEITGADGFTPAWDWTYGSSSIVGGAVSRRIFTAFDAVSIEGELGLAQRFGDDASATETWGALYFRWHEFPWNKYLYTTAAISTGLSYASKLDQVELERSSQGNSKLLHYLSPEVTFALPDRKDLSLVLRIHHRSGGRNYIIGDSDIFGGTSGGAQYLTLGIRKHF